MSTTVKRDLETRSPATMSYRSNSSPQPSLPLVVTLNCIEDVSIEQEYLAGVARVEHVPLSLLAEAKIESAAAVLLHSLAFLPRAAQRRLRPWQIVLCLGSSDRSVDSAIAADLGLGRLVHVDVSRAEEVADTVMALFLGLLRRTHLLSRHALSASGWLGSVQPLCRGMRRCRGLVLGIIGRSASAKSLATRSLAFKISVLYYDVHEEKGKRLSRFPPAARRMDTLNDLLAASDLISLHCALTNDTIQIINAECLQHVKPGCALDGAEGPQWMEAWVREMPNVLILPRSADYSEEVWMEIREKAVSILQTFFMDDVIPTDAISDNDEEESGTLYEDEQSDKQDKDGALHSSTTEQLTDDIHVSFEKSMKNDIPQSLASPSQAQESILLQNTSQSEVKRSRSSKKAKKRHARQKSMHKVGDTSTPHKEDDTAMSGTDQVLSSSSHFASPDDSRSKRTPIGSSIHDLSAKYLKSSSGIGKKSLELLKDGCVISLQARDRAALHVSRQRAQGGGWFLDTMLNVTKRDPAAQFLVVFRSKDTIGLRSFTAGGKLLQINRRMEFVFASHSFDVWESWTFEGSLEECRLVNCRNPSAVLDVRVEILATVGDDDGVTRWLD
ncbi:C-terminal binding protein AN isoform X2 [Cynara cardunculus var. scolymus]|uniref:C-terminal binding protein AN isoform X2 n=1 Tax=Cynara cardunculus var. scolymus TaxID=59895 RepID=UPI000D625B21|nr:C-terminal binding protein AN isoform X2 [Cynara cardunculus var. scolymus]